MICHTTALPRGTGNACSIRTTCGLHKYTSSCQQRTCELNTSARHPASHNPTWVVPNLSACACTCMPPSVQDHLLPTYASPNVSTHICCSLKAPGATGDGSAHYYAAHVEDKPTSFPPSYRTRVSTQAAAKREQHVACLLASATTTSRPLAQAGEDLW